jgi:predicted dinucleotide-binding enzyme
MKIAILGSGNVGGTLGKRWAAVGHTVAFGSRRPDSPEMKALGAVQPAEAVAASDIVLLSTPWFAAREALAQSGPFTGKIVIDALNPLLPNLSGLELGTTTSAAEQVAQWAPGARVVKAFNTVGYNIMANPRFGQTGAVMFYCGDDASAKQAVRQLAAELGFEPVDAGPLTQARLLEPLALLWISLAYQAGLGREIGFQLLRR